MRKKKTQTKLRKKKTNTKGWVESKLSFRNSKIKTQRKLESSHKFVTHIGCFDWETFSTLDQK
jgi:hypothetical protein